MSQCSNEVSSTGTPEDMTVDWYFGILTSLPSHRESSELPQPKAIALALHCMLRNTSWLPICPHTCGYILQSFPLLPGWSTSLPSYSELKLSQCYLVQNLYTVSWKKKPWVAVSKLLEVLSIKIIRVQLKSWQWIISANFLCFLEMLQNALLCTAEKIDPERLFQV